jgi:large subunit ribosomal protein L9
MKVLLLQDVYKLGRAGDVKRVANGYGRNYLIPQGLAVLATPGALKQVERIRVEADQQRAILNQEMSGIAGQLQGLTLTFPARASETGRLYGSINNRMIAETLSEKVGVEISHRQIDSEPLRMIGEHIVDVRLTVDLIPTISVIVYREGESVAAALEEAEAREAEEEAAEAVELDAEAETGEAAQSPEGEEALEAEVAEPAAEPEEEDTPAEEVKEEADAEAEE